MIKSNNRLRQKSYHPSHDLYVIGITGTNGKTTVSYLVNKVLQSAGKNSCVLGTLNSGDKNLSTPESSDIKKRMLDHLKNGGTHFIMEVTSEGIAQSRIVDIEFDLKLLTNITRDHLDYHKTLIEYRKTKLNFMRDGEAHKVYPADFIKEKLFFETKLLGEFNILNMKAAICILKFMGLSKEIIEKTLSLIKAPRGRLEDLVRGQDYKVYIDYAHTPDALENVLKTLKDLALFRKGKLLALFGCGGDRDTGKRKIMGKIASRIADYVVITDDNPRFENSHKIMTDIKFGIEKHFINYVLIQNRKDAIKHIIENANKEDVVVILGKGHETYQIINAETLHHDDREIARNSITNILDAKLLKNQTSSNFIF